MTSVFSFFWWPSRNADRNFGQCLHHICLAIPSNSLVLLLVSTGYSPFDAVTNVKPVFTPRTWWRGWMTACTTWIALFAPPAVSSYDRANNSAWETDSLTVYFTTNCCTTTTGTVVGSNWRPHSGQRTRRLSISVVALAFRKDGRGRGSYRLLSRRPTFRLPWDYRRVQ